MLTIFGWNFGFEERCKGVHCVDLGESFPTSIYLQKSASIQPRTSSSKFYSKLFNIIQSCPYCWCSKSESEWYAMSEPQRIQACRRHIFNFTDQVNYFSLNFVFWLRFWFLFDLGIWKLGNVTSVSFCNIALNVFAREDTFGGRTPRM
jgi:hypothetical protein